MANFNNLNIDGNLSTNTTVIEDSFQIGEYDVENQLVLADKFYDKLNKIYGNHYNITSSVTYTLGTNYSSLSSYSVYLLGNYMRIYGYITRKTASSTGDITNEVMITFTINTNGKASSVYNVSVTNAGYGGNASIQTGNTTITDDGVITTSLTLCSVAQSSSEFSFYCLIPIGINPDAY